MGDHMKQTIKLYIETNRSFIEEKVYDSFRIECVKDHELKDLDVDKMMKLLKLMFHFQGNPSMEEFFDSAPDNIQQFTQDQYKNTSQTEQLSISVERLLQMILYCVQHGFKSQEKEEQKKPQTPKKPIEKQTLEIRELTPKKPIKIIKPPQQPEKQEVKPVRKIYVPKPKTPQIKDFIGKNDMPERNMGARYLDHFKLKKEEKKEQPVLPLVPPIQQSFLEKHRKLIDSRLSYLFRYYCSQQTNIGKSSTFDRIKDEGEKMTIGKFLMFCKVTNIFQKKMIGKATLMAKFKQVSGGHQDIDFEKFKQLLEELDKEYMRAKKQTIHSEIPSYQARLMLQSQKYKTMIKTVDLPFTTRQQNGRQLKEYHTISVGEQPLKGSRLAKQLTTHGGKFSPDLRYELQTKKKLSKHKKPKHSNLNESKIISLDNISDHNLPGMEWIIQQDQTDHTFMRDYKLRDVVGSLKKRVNQFQKMERKH